MRFRGENGVDDLAAELRNLRKGTGLTNAKLANSPAIMRALQAETPSDAYSKFVALLNSLGENIKPASIRNAYGVGYSKAETLTARRDDFGVQFDRHIDTIKGYETEMIEEILAVIFSFFHGNTRRDSVLTIATTRDIFMWSTLQDDQGREVFLVQFNGNRTTFIFQNTTNDILSIKLKWLLVSSEQPDSTNISLRKASQLLELFSISPFQIRLYIESGYEPIIVQPGHYLAISLAEQMRNDVWESMQKLLPDQNNTPSSSNPLSSS